MADPQVALAQTFEKHANDLLEKKDYKAALDKYDTALQIRSSVQGDDHDDVLALHSMIAKVLQETDAKSEAMAKYEKVLEIKRKKHGDDNDDVAVTLSDIGILLEKDGKPAEAQEKLEQALAIRRKGGNNGEAVASALGAMCLTLMKQKKYKEASEKCEERLAILRKVHGDEGESVAEASEQLGECLTADGRHKEAKTKFEEALTIRRKKHADDDYCMASALSGLGLCLHKAGDFAGAHINFQKALEIREKELGVHDLVAETHRSIALVLESEKRHNDRQKAWEKAHTIRFQVYGEGSLEEVDWQMHWGFAYFDSCDLYAYSKASSFFEQGMKRIKKKYGKHSEEVCKIRIHNVKFYELANEGLKADVMMNDLEATRLKLYGKDHLMWAETMELRGEYDERHISLGMGVKDTLKAFQEALNVRQKYLSSDHELVKKSMADVERLQNRLSGKKKAPPQAAPQTGTPQAGASQAGASQAGAPQAGAPQAGALQAGDRQAELQARAELMRKSCCSIM
jgi:tetratricopeptide (TPR) repeat protein